MRSLANVCQTEVSLLVAALGPLVYHRERCLDFVGWVTGEQARDGHADEVDFIFHTYPAWYLALEAVRRAGDPHSSDALGRRAAEHIAGQLPALPGGQNPWPLLVYDILNSEFDFVLRIGGRWLIFEFKVVHTAPLERLPVAEEWQLRCQALASLLMKRISPEVERVDHFFVTNHGGPDITLDMRLPDRTGIHFAAPKRQKELAALGDPSLAVVAEALGAAPTHTVRHLSWLDLLAFLRRYPDLVPLADALRSNPCLFRRKGAR